MTKPTKTLPAGGSLALAALVSSLASCSTTYPRRDPTGDLFPSVRGNALDGTEVALPEAGSGAPLLLLVGYEQDAQFDIDRWLLGLSQAGVQVRTYEVPAIAGMVPRMISGAIDGGMRRGIPAEDWGAVVTLYDDAAPVAALTGSEDGLTGRVLLLDGDGRVTFFHDRGYSVGSLERLQAALAKLEPAGAAAAISVLEAPQAGVLVGNWKADLRPTPDAEPYFAPFVVTSATENALTGSFYGSPIREGRVNVLWGKPYFAFVTDDGSGSYHTAGYWEAGTLHGTTHSLGRDFVSVWTAELEQ